MEIIRLGKKLGGGAEATCYQIDTIDTIDTKNGKPAKSVAKVPSGFGKIWQTQGPEYLKKCLNAIHSKAIDVIEVTIHHDVEVLNENQLRLEPMVIETPLIEDMEERKLTYNDLLDEEQGPDRIRRLIKLVKDGKELREESDLGLDLLGGEIVVEAIQVIVQTAILEAIKFLPPFLRSNIDNQIKGTRGEIRNLMKKTNTDGKETFLLIDPGMHDLSPNGRFKSVTKMINGMSFAALIEAIKRANQKHPLHKRISEEEIASLKHHATPLEQKIAVALVNKMIPMIQRHKQLQLKNQ